MKMVNFRVDDEEHKLMRAIAQSDGLTLTAYIRRHFLIRSRELGLVADPLAAMKLPAQSNQPTTPEVTKRAAPLGINEWRDEVYARRQAGESFADIAASYYGGEVEQIKRLYKRAVDDLQYHKDAGIAYDPSTPHTARTTTAPHTATEDEDDGPLEVDDFDEYVRGLDAEKDKTLVYAPVDPDNPTEAEIATSDAIAQKRLREMGLL